MIRRNETFGKKKLMAFITAFFVTISVYTVTAESGNKSEFRAGMINNLIDLIKKSNKEEIETQTPPAEETPYPNMEESNKPIKDDNIYINVYFHREGVVKEMNLDDYIMGVLYGEVPETYHKEALKAQAIAARSYTIYRINNHITHENGADVCTDYTHCQAWTEAENGGDYPDSIASAVKETHNIIGTYNNECINALYFSNSGGYTESIENVWGGAPYPYLVSVESPGEAENYDYCSVKYYTPEDFVETMYAYSEELECSTDDASANIVQIKRAATGRILSANIGGKTFTGQQLRAMFGTLSSNIHFEKLSNGAIAVVSIGYGHGVGMSQCGAEAMAKNGADYETILKHYYTGINLEKLS